MYHKTQKAAPCNNEGQSADNKKLGKDHSIDIINQELSLNITNGNSSYSSINALVKQWAFNIDNSRFCNDFYLILEDQEDKVLYCFFLERGTITDPTIVFNQRNDDYMKDASIIIIPKNDRNFTNYWQGREFQFINYRILEMNYE